MSQSFSPSQKDKPTSNEGMKVSGSLILAVLFFLFFVAAGILLLVRYLAPIGN